MNTLTQLARSYLEAGGLKIVREKPGFLHLNRRTDNGAQENVLVWIWTEDRARSSELTKSELAAREAREAVLLKGIAAELRREPSATGYLLVESKVGLSQNLVVETSRLFGERGGIRVPVQFFDTSYKIDKPDARRARSALGNLKKNAAPARIPQPFCKRTNLAKASKSESYPDVVAHLAAQLGRPPERPRLYFIDSAAGSGKSVAFSALATSLHESFITAKRACKEQPRPIVFLPEHLRGGKLGYVDDILAAVAETEVAELTTAEQFKWLLKTGHSIWMFDGLDEFYGASSDFLSFVEEALNARDSKAQFVICTRDSLLTASPVVRKFIERRLTRTKDVEILDLEPWTNTTWKALAQAQFKPGAHGEAQAQQFVSAVEGSTKVAALAQNPFYCSVLLSHFISNRALPADDLLALDMLVERMVEREHGKRVFQWQDFVDLEALASAIRDEIARLGITIPNGGDLDALIRRLLDEEARELLFDLLGGVAHRLHRFDDLGAGMSADELGKLVVGGAINDTRERKRLRMALVRFAFFSPGRKAGSLDFTHQLLAEYFAARYAARMLLRTLEQTDEERSNSGKAIDAVAAVGTAPVPEGSIFHRYFVRELSRRPKQRAALAAMLSRRGIKQANVSSFLDLALRGAHDVESTVQGGWWGSAITALFKGTSARQPRVN